MACRVQDKTINGVLELLIAEGFEGMADAMSIMLNETMPLDRSLHLGAGPWERAEVRQGFANGYKLALAEMYVQGVSTRKVASITGELCGFEISSTQVSRAAAVLDEQLTAWRDRPMFWNGSIRQIKRRTRVATLFPNAAFCLRLVTAVVMEISDDWETGSVYLTM